MKLKHISLNTDYKKAPDHHKSMLAEHKAAVYGDAWKKRIEKLQTGDTVFLYKSGSGIVAYGVADGIVNTIDRDCEYNMHLNKFAILEKPINAAQIKQITKHDFSFKQTMITITNDAAEKILEAIKDPTHKIEV